jgi:HAD superfamily hydrolase (TIGR01509 family)
VIPHLTAIGMTRGPSLSRTPHAVVFDMDGLLFDTERLYQQALVLAALSGGQEVPPDFFQQTVGLPWVATRALFLSHFGEAFPIDEFQAAWVRHFWDLADGRPLLRPGALELLDALRLRGLPCAIATSSSPHTVERHLKAHNLMGRFQAIVAHGDYEKGKPEPDPFLKAAARLGIEPYLCVALEDSYNGVRSASSAGMMTIMVPDLLQPSDEIRQLCDLVAVDLLEVHRLIAAHGRHSLPDATP